MKNKRMATFMVPEYGGVLFTEETSETKIVMSPMMWVAVVACIGVVGMVFMHKRMFSR